MKLKSDIVDSVSTVTGLDNKITSKAVTAVFATILDSLAKGESVMITNFGTFSVEAKKPRKVKNPRTGAVDTVNARNVPTFHFSEKVRISFRDEKQQEFITTEATQNADNKC